MQNGLQSVVDARVMYIDMNAFYASIEQQYNPALREVPVAVVSHRTPSGTVLASSYEAKALGITTGTKLRDALVLYPKLAIAETHAQLYRSVHIRLRSILGETFGPEVEVRSVDEATVRLSPNQTGSDRCHSLACLFKERVRTQLGEYIRCSIGIAPNSLLAKVATDIRKPDGLFEITGQNTPEVLSGLSITDLPGIAAKNAVHLSNHGITSPLEFYQTPADQLRAWFGIWGQYWWWNLHGYEIPSAPSLPHAMSHEHVLKKWLYRNDQTYLVIISMADRVIHRLRRNNYQCQSLHLSISFSGIPRFTAEKYFDAPTSSYTELLDGVASLCSHLPNTFPAPVRKVCITLGRITQKFGVQSSIFEGPDCGEQLSGAIHQIRERHGFEAIRPARSLIPKSATLKEQPGFGKIRDHLTY